MLPESFRLVYAAIISGTLVSGCMLPIEIPTLPSNSQSTGPCLGGAPGQIADFEVAVTAADWKDSVENPNYKFLTSSQVSKGIIDESQLYAKPKANFLTVKLRITNTSSAPIAWTHQNYHFVFNLVNLQGTTYEYDRQHSEITMQMGGMGNLNPGIPEETTVVFDVPKDSYTFTIEQQRLTGYARWLQTRAFQCSVL